ncbi:hypothetical protein [Aeromonas media]|uniref:hypothetical protein n=1 Tax=Aeromonas media TaxID=651 RepID=UPI00384A88FD
MASPLEDLDELILRCRDEKARAHITEAVASYRAGAFRSAIVATWIAVCFDVIEKLKELTLAGDKEAELQVQAIEKTHRTNDVTAALKFERELLGLAKDKFELLSPIEYEDLKRLQDDRNRCAHPSLSSDDQAYTPPAELARLHIHSAVIHLLQHPPVQGKYALERLLKEIDSDYFPTTVKEAQLVFRAGPLRRPRDSLVRSLVIVLCKVLLTENDQWRKRTQRVTAIKAVDSLHHAASSKAKKDTLSKLFRGVEDKDIPNAINFLINLKESWEFLEDDIQQKLKRFVLSLNAEHFPRFIESLIEYQPLKPQAQIRLRRATKQDLKKIWLGFGTPTEVLDRIIDVYLQSNTYDEANDWAKDLSQIGSDFSAEQIRKMLSGIADNDQITGSFQLGALISSLRSTNKIPEEEFEELLQDNGLNEYCLATQDDDF